MIDEDVLVLADEVVLPKELYEGFTEKVHPQGVIVLLEDAEQRMLLLGRVRRPLDDAREENEKHLLHAFLVKEILGHLYALAHKLAYLLKVVRGVPVLDPFLVVIPFELLA